MTAPPEDDQASSLAAMISALRSIDEEQKQGRSWADIGGDLGLSGRQAKKHAHWLKGQVKERLAAMLAQKSAATGSAPGA